METTDRDMANTVVMLDEAVTERICDAMVCLLDGTDTPRYNKRAGKQPNQWEMRDTLLSALMDSLKPNLQQLIRQEIADVFQGSTGGLPRHVGLGDTLSIDLSSIVVTGAS
jgi:hypothetical protein